MVGSGAGVFGEVEGSFSVTIFDSGAGLESARGGGNGDMSGVVG